MTELPEELKKAELTTQQVVEQIDALHRDPLFGLLHVANPELRQADYLLGKWLPSSVVASFLEKARKQREAELLSLRNELRRKLREEFTPEVFMVNIKTPKDLKKWIDYQIDAVFGGERK